MRDEAEGTDISSPPSSELIRILKAEMNNDIREIDIPSDREDEIDITRVNEWYVETEKLIRVIGNLFTVPLSQAINQLRYAGHHILRCNLTDDEKAKKQNIIEAFKHCKRAYYDALDFYIYKLAEDYRVLLPFLDGEKTSKIERIIREHLQNIKSCRFESERRIEYYKGVQDTLVRGLEIIEQLNEIQRESGISKKLYTGKAALLNENATLRNHLIALKGENALLNGKIEGRSYATAVAATLVIGLATVGGLTINAFLTDKHEITIMSPTTEKELGNLGHPVPGKGKQGEAQKPNG